MESSIELDQRVHSSNHILYLQISTISCVFECRDTVICDQLKRLYHDYVAKQPANIVVTLEVTERLTQDDLDLVISKTRHTPKNGNRFRTASQIISGQYKLEQSVVGIKGEKSLVESVRGI